MRACEWVAVIYFGYLAGLAWAWPMHARARWRVTLMAGAAAASVLAVAGADPGSFAGLARDWLPAALILAGYWLSGSFYLRPMEHVERSFAAIDERMLYRSGLMRAVAGAPRVVLEYLELAYAGCYAFVPAGFAVLKAAGREADADRFWTLVLIGELGAFAMLPWIQTRPPRALESPGPMDLRPLLFRRLNAAIVERGSIRVNTFPSGHAAGSLATAIGLLEAAPAAGAAFLLFALSITAASVVGRYHYLVDAVAGFALALAGWAVARAAGL